MANKGPSPQIGITNKERYGEDYYSKLGDKGVKEYKRRQALGIAKPRGFAWMKATGQIDKIKQAGRKGGSISRRPKKDEI